MYINYTKQQEMEVCGSTLYYQKNRLSKKVVYSCPNCNFETANSKISLTNHINAKHTPENEKPFQCDHCERGFAQKINLIKHMKQMHNIEMPSKREIILYNITVTNVLPKAKKTIARRNYYLNHNLLKSSDVYNKKHIYLPGVHLKNHDIHYDVKKGFITLHKLHLKNFITIKKRKKKNIL